MRLVDFAHLHCDQGDYSDGYRDQLRWCINAIETQIGKPVETIELSATLINSHLRYCKTKGLRDETRKSRRRNLVTLWKSAAKRGLAPPFSNDDIAPVRVRDHIPQAWSVQEVRRLYEAAGRLRGAHNYNGRPMRKSLYWQAYILAAWDTGLRGCDLRCLERLSVPASGRLTIIQRKTGKRVVLQLRPVTMTAIDATIADCERPRIWPQWGRLEVWRRAAKSLVKSAGLLPGSIGMIRHSSGTAVEEIAPGGGHTHLGNSRDVFERYYLDETKREKPVLPPPLLDDE